MQKIIIGHEEIMTHELRSYSNLQVNFRKAPTIPSNKIFTIKSPRGASWSWP